jgi:hypothetical protein
MFPSKKSTPESVGLTPLELERVLPMAEACEQTSLSADTLQRRYPELIVRLSPRRKGIKLRNVLAISSGHAAAATKKPVSSA